MDLLLPRGEERREDEEQQQEIHSSCLPLLNACLQAYRNLKVYLGVGSEARKCIFLIKIREYHRFCLTKNDYLSECNLLLASVSSIKFQHHGFYQLSALKFSEYLTTKSCFDHLIQLWKLKMIILSECVTWFFAPVDSTQDYSTWAYIVQTARLWMPFIWIVYQINIIYWSKRTMWGVTAQI